MLPRMVRRAIHQAAAGTTDPPMADLEPGVYFDFIVRTELGEARLLFALGPFRLKESGQ